MGVPDMMILSMAMALVSFGAAHAQSAATDAAPDYPNQPEMSARLAESTIEATPTTPEELAAFIRAETDKWIRVVTDACIEKQLRQ